MNPKADFKFQVARTILTKTMVVGSNSNVIEANIFVLGIS